MALPLVEGVRGDAQGEETLSADEASLREEALLRTGCACPLCVRFLKDFKKCGQCFKGAKSQHRDCCFNDHRIRFVGKHWKAMLTQYLKRIAHGEAPNPQAATAEVRKQAQDLAQAKWEAQKTAQLSILIIQSPIPSQAPERKSLNP